MSIHCQPSGGIKKQLIKDATTIDSSSVAACNMELNEDASSPRLHEKLSVPVCKTSSNKDDTNQPVCDTSNPTCKNIVVNINTDERVSHICYSTLRNINSIFLLKLTIFYE